jgi:hypothetical protein
MSSRSRWDFEYAPIPVGGGDIGTPESDLVLATEDDVDPAEIVSALGSLVASIAAIPIFSDHPIFWTRLQASDPIERNEVVLRLTSSRIRVRYVASARMGSQRLPPRLGIEGARMRRASTWNVRRACSFPEKDSPWRWFLRSEGAEVMRDVCGTGAGTRVAVIDNDGRDLEHVDLDAEVLVGVNAVPRAAAHAALLMGWCVGARTQTGAVFRGVAPDSSPRLYCIPKAADDVVSLPLAIVRAVNDGADVVVCATYVEGQTSPLLDDALEFATRLGRGGRGAAIVMPTGREMGSPPGSVHSSLSLGLADPAGDPRVFCVGPSSRVSGWFLWRDRHGKLRPFANRGPSVRWLAPGDDMAHPFVGDGRPAHAESSGASAIAAGVLLLVLERNPELRLSELDALLTATVTKIEPLGRGNDPEVADPANLLPLGLDADGHNPKHGYGCLNATAACVAAADPIAAALVRIGELDAARRFIRLREDCSIAGLYSRQLARWAARTMLYDAQLQHALSSVVRAARLASQYPERFTQQPPGHLLRQLGTALGLICRANPSSELACELSTVAERIRSALNDDRTARKVERLTLELMLNVFRSRDDTSTGDAELSRRTG